jgi:diguanylate cyclase (GGDEF)-like protein
VVCVAEDLSASHALSREAARHHELHQGTSPKRKRATRHNIRFVLVLIDADRLGEFNECQSTTAGDAAWSAAAEVLRSGIRDADVIACIGCDEFALLLQHTDGQHDRTVTDSL